MPKWFVYSNEEYYPSAEIVEADELADVLARFDRLDRRAGIAVFPLDSLAHWECDNGEPITDRAQGLMRP